MRLKNRRELMDGGSMQSDSTKNSKDNIQPDAAAGTASQKIGEGLQERGTLEDWERSAVTEPQPNETGGNPERGTREDWDRSAVVEPHADQAAGTQLRGTRVDWERGVKADESTKTSAGSHLGAAESTADDTGEERVTFRDGTPRD
jgi:hypothetical protein